MMMQCLCCQHVLLGTNLTCQLTGFGFVEDIMARHQYGTSTKVRRILIDYELAVHMFYKSVQL